MRRIKSQAGCCVYAIDLRENWGIMSKLLYTSALGLLCVHATYAVPQQRERTRDSQSPSLINIRVSRTVQAVNYRDRASTKIDFRGTPLMPRVEGKADIEAKRGRIAIKAEFEHL